MFLCKLVSEMKGVFVCVCVIVVWVGRWCSVSSIIFMFSGIVIRNSMC